MSQSNKDNHPYLSPEEKWQMEKEIEKLKNSAFNPQQSHSEDQASPDIDKWLTYLMHSGQYPDNIARITITEKLGCPDFPAAEALTEEDTERKLEEVQQLMARNGVYLDVLSDVSDTEIYRFITEELFQEKVDDIEIEGLSITFIYEEFYPSDKLDIEQTVTSFIHEMLGKSFQDYLDIHLADICRTLKGESLSAETVAEMTVAFSESYDQFEIEFINDFQFDIDEQKEEARTTFSISYCAELDENRTHFKGECTAWMEKGKLGYWNIVKLDMPGFTF